MDNKSITTFAPQKKIATEKQKSIDNLVNGILLPKQSITTFAPQKKIAMPKQGSNDNKTRVITPIATPLQGSNNNKSPATPKGDTGGKTPTTLQGSNDNKTRIITPMTTIQPKQNNVSTPATGNLDTLFSQPTTKTTINNNSGNPKTNITESNVVMPNKSEFNQPAPQLVPQVTDNTELIKNLYSEEKRQQLINDYTTQKELLESEANLQKEKNIINTEQTIRQAYSNTNQMLRDLAQIKSNLGGASTSDPTYKQGMITVNTSLTNLVADSQAQLNELNSMVEVEKQKAINQNNMNKYDKLQAFDTALTAAYVNEITRIDNIKNSVNEKNADLQMAQAQLNESSFEFSTKLAQQEKERQDANKWKEIANEQWNAQYNLSLKQYNSDNAYKLAQLKLSKSQIDNQAKQWAIEQANAQMQFNAQLKLEYDKAGASGSTASYGEILYTSLKDNVMTNAYYTSIGGAEDVAKTSINNAYSQGRISADEKERLYQRLGLN